MKIVSQSEETRVKMQFMESDDLIDSIPKVTFHGAVLTVTGSMHLVEAAGRKILLDCGLYLGQQPELRQRNREFPFTPKDIDAVVISHAHIDHCGNLPNLVRQGFTGPIFCTPATRDLLGVMLTDSAKIQRDEKPLVPPPSWSGPLCDLGDVARTIGHCVPLGYDEPGRVSPEIEVRLLNAGHILGSAIVTLGINTGGKDYRISFTGDLGRANIPFLNPPAPIPPSDLLICECTYGGKVHQPLDTLAEQLSDVIDRTVAQDGKVLIPAFSLGRAQIVVHYLQKWIHEGMIPKLPIYVDSPLVADIVNVYHQHLDDVTEDCRAVFEAERQHNSPVRYIRRWEESKRLTDDKTPSIIVASGGMLDAGRALYHLQQYVEDPRCCLVLVSYQAPGSLGRRLMQKGPTVYFLGKMWNKWADAVHLNGFSGHADHNDFLEMLTPLASQTGKVRLVHGEVEPAEILCHALRQVGFEDVAIPLRDETVLVEKK